MAKKRANFGAISDDFRPLIASISGTDRNIQNRKINRSTTTPFRDVGRKLGELL